MAEIVYEVVEHDGGWAYRLGGVYSETFASHDEAAEAAKRVATEHRLRGPTEEIEYQDEEGRWHQETAAGDERPDTEVQDRSSR